jgi:hypothetical protein
MGTKFAMPEISFNTKDFPSVRFLLKAEHILKDVSNGLLWGSGGYIMTLYVYSAE